MLLSHKVRENHYRPTIDNMGVNLRCVGDCCEREVTSRLSDIRLLGAIEIVLGADSITKTIQQVSWVPAQYEAGLLAAQDTPFSRE